MLSPRLLDVSGALDALPSLSQDNDPKPTRERARATRTEAAWPFSVALPVAATDGKGTTSGALVAKRRTPASVGPGSNDLP
jgi:hypothetical protein